MTVQSRVLELEELETDRFAAPHPEDDPEGWNVIFSGQLLAQMIMAADSVFAGKLDVKSIQAIFSRAGNYDSPLELRTETTHAGRLFGSTTVTAYQGERLLSRGLILGSADEEDLVRHGPKAPEVPAPDSLAADPKAQCFPGAETRRVPSTEVSATAEGAPGLDFWVRYPGGAPSVAIAQAILAWSQPGEFIGLAMQPHADVMSIEDAHKHLSTGVIAHTIHFQERFDIGDWLLVSLGGSVASRGRVYGEGRVFDRAGRLVSTFSQDSMLKAATGGKL
ncbi:MAG: acyl-CoA thioesterase [Myxococcota bacterium]